MSVPGIRWKRDIKIQTWSWKRQYNSQTPVAMVACREFGGRIIKIVRETANPSRPRSLTMEHSYSISCSTRIRVPVYLWDRTHAHARTHAHIHICARVSRGELSGARASICATNHDHPTWYRDRWRVYSLPTHRAEIKFYPRMKNAFGKPRLLCNSSRVNHFLLHVQR